MLTLIPEDDNVPMRASLEYRLVNKMQSRFVYETLILVALGVLFIVIFGIFLYKALQRSIQYEIHESRQRYVDREHRRLYGLNFNGFNLQENNGPYGLLPGIEHARLQEQ